MNIAEKVSELVRPAVEEAGCFLWDVFYGKEGRRQILRITIDRDGGVDIDDCERVTRAVDPILDEADPIPVSYCLEVSSPGIERELRLPFHFQREIGHTVDVRLYTNYEGSKQYIGVLSDYDETAGTITVDKTVLPLDKVARVTVHFDFENSGL